jgi:hypothetical protein
LGRRPILIAVPCVLGAAVALLAPGCIADLPAATQCPPAAKHAQGNCDLSQNMDAPPCISPNVSSCLTGPRPSCECHSSECPDDPAACYPPGDCPPEVVRSVGAGRKITCIRVAEVDLKSMLAPLGNDCVCGCSACASVCDGVGPVIAFVSPQANPPMPGPPALFVDNLAAYVPSSGQIGLYVRARGMPGSLALGVALPDGGGLGTPINGGSGDFSDTVLWDAQKSPTWTNSAGAPNSIAVVVNELPMPTFAVLEIDCIVPFVVANP